MTKPRIRRSRVLILAFAIALFLAVGLHGASAQSGAPTSRDTSPQTAMGSPMHPPFQVLDALGRNVLESGRPMSTMRTCSQCHDTEFIASHSYHSDMGLSDIIESRPPASGEPWDASNGPFGRWDPLFYRYLTQPGDERFDLGTPEWVMTFGRWHVGGGPATTSREGLPLTYLLPDATNPETSMLDPDTGTRRAWNWKTSGVVEMNCFLCHSPHPNNDARIEALKSGDFAWANTATLLGTGIVKKTEQGWQWNPSAFDENGKLKPDFVAIQEPKNENCGLCHAPVQTDPTHPVLVSDLSPHTAATGQVFSGQQIAESAMNIVDKENLTRSWDVHLNRGLDCVDCHYAPNNPSYYREREENRPPSLLYDPRRLTIGDYLKLPDHDFARGETAQHPIDPNSRGTMRRCEDCHDAQQIHSPWLPYSNRHLTVLSCESCHIPKLYAPAIEAYDWTVLMPDMGPRKIYRGLDGPAKMPVNDVPVTVMNLVSGYEPVILQRNNSDGTNWLAPYNLIATWFWVYDDANGNTRPVRLADLKAAWFEGDRYAPEIVSALDSNNDGTLEESELVLDTAAKQTVVAKRLESLGLHNPRIEARLHPYSIGHNVAEKDWATQDCHTCHYPTSRLTQSMRIGVGIPGDVIPKFTKDANVSPAGYFYVQDNTLYFRPDTRAYGLYILGRDRIPIIDWFGLALFVGVLIAVTVHASLRIYAAKRRRARGLPEVEELYLYTPFERFWHWLQAVSIGILLVTGLLIHRPDIWPALSNFRYLVPIHNVTALLLIIDAFLALFYHVTTGAIREFIPRPKGFFDQAFMQARYYLYGIFRGEPHPFEKYPGHKLNPLQQVTYFALLNVLLPVQVVVGVLMWSEQYWPRLVQKFGGLHVLAPIHTLVAWLLASFIVGHVYLTTTGLTPLEDIRGMITGWERVEVERSHSDQGEST